MREAMTLWAHVAVLRMRFCDCGCPLTTRPITYWVAVAVAVVGWWWCVCGGGRCRPGGLRHCRRNGRDSRPPPPSHFLPHHAQMGPRLLRLLQLSALLSIREELCWTLPEKPYLGAEKDAGALDTAFWLLMGAESDPFSKFSCGHDASHQECAGMLWSNSGSSREQGHAEWSPQRNPNRGGEGSQAWFLHPELHECNASGATCCRS